MATLICPRCERPMQSGHECGALTRRFFFGIFAGAAVALAALPPVVESSGEMVDLRFAPAFRVHDLIRRLAVGHHDWKFETRAVGNHQSLTVIRSSHRVTHTILHRGEPGGHSFLQGRIA